MDRSRLRRKSNDPRARGEAGLRAAGMTLPDANVAFCRPKEELGDLHQKPRHVDSVPKTGRGALQESEQEFAHFAALQEPNALDRYTRVTFVFV